jgi:hypothetical protein
VSLTALRALVRLALARAARRPGRWVLTAAGIALAVAFAGAVVAEATIAADQTARSVLARLPALERTVRVNWQDVVTPDGRRRASELLARLHLRDQTEVVQLGPVRLDGIVVRPAGIAPLAPWISNATGQPADPPSSCGSRVCPVLLANGVLGLRTLTATGVRMPVVGRTHLVSPLPLGVIPGSDSAPVVLSSDPRGLEALGGLSGIYRMHSWVAPLPVSQLHSWQLGGLETRLRQAQDRLIGTDIQLVAPFAGLDAARSQADAAPRRLLLAGGGAVAALALFVLLAAGGLRRDQSLELARLRVAGARPGHSGAFLLAEAGLLCGVAAVCGAVLAVIAAAVLAHADGIPAGAALSHSLLTPGGLAGLLGAWLATTALLAGSAVVSGPWLADVLAIAAAAAVALALSVKRSDSGPLAVLIAPLCCLAAGVLVFRGAAGLLRLSERLARRGPVMTRLALVGLARAPAMPALAIAFIAVSIGLGGFALSYRATLLRGTADQAADRVPLDAIIAPGGDFTRPLQLASLERWHQLTGGSVWPVRRTDASFVSGAASVTVPALGVPAGALERMHGWRASDGTAPLPVLARRLVPSGPVRTPGPVLPVGLRRLAVRVASPAVAVTVTANLRDGRGLIRRLVLGQAVGAARTLSAALPAGRWELEALELQEPTGLDATNGHQNAENPAPDTRFTGTVTLQATATPGVRLADWRGAGAITGVRSRGAGVVVRFATTGETGILRPTQPSDVRAVPVLADAATPRGSRVALTVDGLPVAARVVGVLRRFPTLPAGAAGFLVADEATLASALDAQTPGQGLADELWQEGGQAVAPFGTLTYSRRAVIAHQLRSAPIARGVLGTLIAAAILGVVLAIVGLVVALVGGARDRQVERDLVAQGVGVHGLRHELRLRMSFAAAFGVVAGLAIAALLTVLAVASVRAGITVGTPEPPLVTITPWMALVGWAAAALALLLVAGWLASQGAGSWRGGRSWRGGGSRSGASA